MGKLDPLLKPGLQCVMWPIYNGTVGKLAPLLKLGLQCGTGPIYNGTVWVNFFPAEAGGCGLIFN